MKKYKILTSKQEVYEKLIMLNIVNEVIIDNNKVINNILSKLDGIETENIPNNRLLVKKNKPIRLDIYLR